ncbi:ATP-binding cassette domain-containing protein [uncultured Methylibium sp.]|uniref:ATP-binding cassette domain-containing protein n=1 Tax=uncultured Methylibium sp. TaxID=381093 RepID=UPI0025F278D8|nr:ATP-binding cassette domain-containing protein [uncultured Methylibium sp.]
MQTLELDVTEFYTAPLQREAVLPVALAPSPGAPRGTALALAGVGKRFGTREVLRGIDLRVAPGEFVAIVGRSGCGKSTLLRLLAGLERLSEGAIALDGVGGDTRREDLRVMFQDARLLPWKRVIDNVALGLGGPDARERALEALAQVGLAERADEWPAILSGGQRQRVALARALVHTPRLLLLDEPLGALDALTRIEMQQLIERLWRQHGFTALLVTHDVGEAVALADRVLLIEDGELALDERVALPRPRSRGDAAYAALEERILDRVLQRPDAGLPSQSPPSWDVPALRWAV